MFGGSGSDTTVDGLIESLLLLRKTLRPDVSKLILTPLGSTISLIYPHGVDRFEYFSLGFVAVGRGLVYYRNDGHGTSRRRGISQ